jgi:hypothetical protein
MKGKRWDIKKEDIRARKTKGKQIKDKMNERKAGKFEKVQMKHEGKV